MQVSDIICATIVDYLTEITPNLDPYFHERLAQLLLLRVGLYFLGLIILSILIFVTTVCAKRTGAAVSVERRRRAVP
jgi:hypothetical protein